MIWDAYASRLASSGPNMFKTRSDDTPAEDASPARICISASAISDIIGNIFCANILSDILRSETSTNSTIMSMFCKPWSPIFTVVAATSGICAKRFSICIAIDSDFSNVEPIGARAVIVISFASVDGENSLPTNFINIVEAINITTAIPTTRHGCRPWYSNQRRIQPVLVGFGYSFCFFLANLLFLSVKRKNLAIIIGVNVNENI